MANEQNLIPITKETAKELGARGGRAKKGSKHINTWVQELMTDPDFETWISDPKEGYIHYKGAPITAIIKAQIKKAAQGDTKAYDALVKSGWSQKIETEHSGEQKIEVITRHAGSPTAHADNDN